MTKNRIIDNKPTHPDYYAQAKFYQYQERNLPLALRYYQLAFKFGQKVDSAIKDTAAVLHQMGNTKEACQFLVENRKFIRGDLRKYDNLLRNLQKQITPSGKFMNKSLLIMESGAGTSADVQALFSNSSRIEKITFFKNLSLDQEQPAGPIVLLSFQSYSSAKKTLQTIKRNDSSYRLPERLKIYWVNVNKLVVAQAYPKDSNVNSFYYGDSTWGWTLFLPIEGDPQSSPQHKNEKENHMNKEEEETWRRKGSCQLQGLIRLKENNLKIEKMDNFDRLF